ncbi:MAG TPA: CDGSH iron-sulfur domain-containing protein [candidate division Zixibacteria bacterium]|nr:CDGSH iron-sulfur domain-containing protein [candidate division Zixibacteria bacterium]
MSDDKIKVTVIKNGPLRVEAAKFEIVNSDGTTIEKNGPVHFCRCGHSKNKPFCDGAHVKAGFEG